MNRSAVVRCREAAVQKRNALAGVLIVLLAATQALGAEAVLLKSRRFVPKTSLDGLASVRQDHRSERIHAILQLDSVPTVEQKATLAGAQVRLLSYIPNHAWLASFPLRAAERIAAIPGVRALAKIEPQDKIDPSLRDGGVNAYSRTADDAVRLIVTLFEDADVEEAVATIVRLGGQIVGRAEAGRDIVLLLPVDRIADLASCDGVK